MKASKEELFRLIQSKRAKHISIEAAREFLISTCEYQTYIRPKEKNFFKCVEHKSVRSISVSKKQIKFLILSKDPYLTYAAHVIDETQPFREIIHCAPYIILVNAFKDTYCFYRFEENTLKFQENKIKKEIRDAYLESCLP